MTHDSKELEELARDLALAFHGDEVEWRGFLSKAALILSNKSARFAAKAAPQPGMRAEGERPRWRHKNRGTFYTEIGRGLLQSMDTGGLADGETMVIYQGDDGKFWVRDAIEFEDGRFEFVPPNALPAASPAEASKHRFIDDTHETAEWLRQTAPPKPAPDAMREALLKRTVEFIQANDPFGDVFSEHDLKLFRGESLMTDKADTASEPCSICGVLVSQVPGEGHHWGQCAICKKWNTRASAPVPPPDGAAERKMVAEIPFDPTNHHNALKCPYCNPEGLKFADAIALRSPAPDATVSEPKVTDDQFEDMVLAAMHTTMNSAAIKALTATKWKDGIDIERATYSAILFAKEILRSSPQHVGREGVVSEKKRWYLACQNDGLFIINAESRPSNDDQWHDRPDGPTIVLNVAELPEAKAIKIVGVLNDLAAPVSARDAVIEEIAQRVFARLEPSARIGRHEIQRAIRSLTGAKP